MNQQFHFWVYTPKCLNLNLENIFPLRFIAVLFMIAHIWKMPHIKEEMTRDRDYGTYEQWNISQL